MSLPRLNRVNRYLCKAVVIHPQPPDFHYIYIHNLFLAEQTGFFSCDYSSITNNYQTGFNKTPEVGIYLVSGEGVKQAVAGIISGQI